MNLNLPASILVKELLQTHPKYNRAMLQKYHDFYAAGHCFESNKRRYMRPRQLEMQVGGDKYTRARLACYHYTPHSSGIIDDLAGAALQSPPRIEVVDPAAPAAEYWLGLNTNIDGAGRTVPSLCGSRFTQSAVHHRAYLVIDFPDASGTNIYGVQRQRGELDARICAADAIDIDDWEVDDDNNLLWARSHVVQFVRAVPYGPRTLEQHTWTFYTDESITEYTASKDIKEKEFPEDAVARGGVPKPHALAALPIIPCEQPHELWVMDRLISTAEALFNREGAREYALDSGALSLPVYSGNENPGNIVLSEAGCIYVGPGGDFKWAGPDGAVYTAQKESAGDLRENLFGCVQALAKQAAGQQDNARQSGTAKMQDKAPMAHLLSLLAKPVVSGMQKACDLIAIMRNEEDVKPTLKGMDDFDVQGVEMEINKTATFVSIPGCLPSAKRYANLTLATQVYPDAPDEEKAKWVAEAEKLPLEAPVETASGGPKVMRNGKTNEPAGMEINAARVKATANMQSGNN